MDKKNCIICLSKSQRNPKRSERYSLCQQYAKEVNFNVKEVFKFQYDDFEQSKNNLLRNLKTSPDVNTIIISDCTRISRSIPKMIDFLISLERKDIVVHDVRQEKYVTFRDILLNSTKEKYATKEGKS